MLVVWSFSINFLKITDSQEVHDSLKKGSSEKRKLQDESLKQLGKYVINKYIPSMSL